MATARIDKTLQGRITFQKAVKVAAPQALPGGAGLIALL